ncbi:MAG: hypothetical protein KHY26_01250 [Faecalibacterium prausnitzii]|jgi:hypothetical protein|nr:hypothetical protein [Faecalibacterium prausnitzii]DAN90961.1 MAG TPA: tail tape measure [Caudoviricetes sp.]
MSQEVDSRVVEMRFDNANFEKNTRKTIASVDRLMEKLQFKGAEKGLEKLNAAAKDVDFGPMDESLTVLERHFSAFEIVTATALVNITNKFVNAGEKLVKSLSVDQVMSGWDKYTEKTGNVQTIMNATGKSIDQVNGYLNKLMWYSDETSYSFNEMTSALSQMTAAGGRIDKMIPMIMGIANATADAGKIGFAFQSTIRNLTQSYSAGHLQLQDWKSLNLMGTATKALKQELIDTAVELGVIKEGEVTIASFESSLQKKWANTEVMEKTFAKYASMMEAAYELTQKNPGMTSSEALEQLKGQYGELAERAALAAQQATSFAQAIDSAKDAVSSKWMAVFETIFGNKEEATDTWTELANRLYDIFVPPIEALNDRMKEGLDSGWQQMRDAFGDQADAYTTVLEKLALAKGAVTEEAIEEEGSFAKALQKGKVDAELLTTSLSDTIKTYAELLETMDEADPRYPYIQKDYEAFLKLNDAVADGSLDLAQYAKGLTEVSGREHLFNSVWNIWDAIGKVAGSIHDAFAEIFPPTSGEQIHSIAEGLDVMTKKLIITDETAENLKKTFKGVFAVVKVPLTAMTTLAKTGARAFGVLADISRPVGAVLLEVAGNMGSFVSEMQSTLLGSGTLGEKLDAIAKSARKLLNPLTTLDGVLKKSIGEKLTEARKEISKWADSLPDGVREGVHTLLGILEGLGAGTLTVAGVVGGALSGLKKSAVKALETVGSVITGQSRKLSGYKDVLTSLPAIVGAAVSAFAEEFKGAAGNVESAASRVYEPMKAFFKALKDGFDSISGTDIYRFMSLLDVGLLSYAIAQFAKAMNSLRKMLATPLSNMLNSISGSFNALTGALKTWQKQENTKILTGIGSALLMLAGAMFIMSRIDPERYTSVLVGTMLLIAELVTAAKLLKPEVKAFDSAVSGLGTQLLKASTLWGTAAALLGLAAATKAMCSGFVAIADAIKGENFLQNLAAFVAAVTGMYVLTRNMGLLIATVKARDLVVGGKTLLGIGAAIIEMGVAMRIAAGAVEPLSKIPYTSLFKATAALAAMASILTAMGAALVLFQAASDTMLVFQNGLAIAAMGGGMWVLVQGVCALAGLITENVDDGTLNTTKLEYATTAMKTLMILMTAMSALSSKTKFSSGAAVLAMAGAMNAVAVAAAALCLIPWPQLGKAAAVLAGLTGAMLALGVIGSAGWSEGAGIFLMADALMAVAGACLMLSKVTLPDMAKAGAALLALSIIGGALSNFAGSVNFMGVSTGMLAMSAALLVLAPAIRLLGEARPEQVGQALQVFLDGMLVVLLGSAMLTAMPQLAVGLELLAKAFEKFGKGMLYLAGAGALFGALALFADPLCTAIINAAPDIEAALVAVVTLICGAINQSAEPIGEAFTTLCKVLIQTAIDLIGWAWSGEGGEGNGIKGALEELGKNIWDSIRDIFSPFSGNGNFQQRNVAFKFNPDFKPQRVNVADVFTFSGAKDDAEKEGKEIGGNVANGGAKGVEENKARATGAVQGMVDDTIDAAKKGYDINSPSKVFEEIGRYITEGLAIGIGDQSVLAGATSAIQTVAQSIRNVFTTFWGIHSPSQLAEEDGRNIVEGLRLGIGDSDLRNQLYDASYDSALQVRDAVGAALDEAKKTASEKMLELYSIIKANHLMPDGTLPSGKAGLGANRYQQAVRDYEKANAKEDARNTPYLGADWKPSSMWDKATEALRKYESGEIKAKDALKDLTGEARDWAAKQIGSALGLEGLNPSEYADLILEQYSGYLLDDAPKPTGSGGKGGRGSSSGKGKTLAETIAEKYTKELKANKYLQNAADKEYSLWEAGEGNTASIEALIQKKGETLAKSIELQTARVDIAQRQYDELVSRAGANDDKTKEAYTTLLDEKKALLDLQQARFENAYKAALERYESDDKLAQTEYQIWADTYEKTASVTEKSNRNIKAINKRLAIQSEKTALAEKAWVETKDALGEASRVTQQAYLDYLEAQQEKLELESELDKAQLAAFDDLSRFYDSRISMAQKRMDLLNKLYNDGELSGRADAYEAAVKEYGEGSLEARRAATQGTMTALMGVNSALTSMRWQMSRVTAMQRKYQTALEQAGGNHYDETVMAAYKDMMDSRLTFADYVGDLADAFDVSDATKRTMMQLGDAIAKNWKPIQNGFSKVWTQVEKRFPQTAEKLANFVGLYMRDGATETISATMNAIVSAMNGDWASAVASGLTAVLDVVGTDFGQTLTEAISAALKKAFGGNGLFAQLLTKLSGSIDTGGSGSSGSLFSAIGKLLKGGASAAKSFLGGASGAAKLIPVLNSVGTATANVASGVTTVAKAAGAAKVAATAAGAATSGTLAKVGMGVANVAASLGPHGLLVGACVAGAALVGTAVVKNWDKVKAGIGKAWDWIKEKAANLWSGVKGLVGGAINVGKNVVGGLWNGIKGVAGGLWNGIKGIGRGIINGFKSIFGIHSPSTVFAGIGGYLMEGLAKGITATADGVDRSLEEVTDGALAVAMSGAEHLLAALNSEDDPVIRPVVDLSDAESSLRWMDDQMAGSYTRSLNVQRSAALAGAVSAKANRQNGGDEKDPEDDKTGSENHEVVEAIRQMGERIDGVARAVAGMKVVMNSRKLVGEIKTDMNNALGAMAEKGR